MLHLFSAETGTESDFPDEQIRTVIHALRREGKAQEIIYHTENKESFRYVITTEILIDSKEKVIRSTTSVDKFRLQEDEFLEFIQDTLDEGLVREKQYTLPLQEDRDHQAREECLRQVAVKHLRCINKIERIASAPKQHPVVQQSSGRTTCLLFTLFIVLLGSSLYCLLPFFTHKHAADLTLLFNTVDVQVRLGTEKHRSTGNRLDLTLPPGRYKLQAEKQGFKPVRQDIFLSTDEEVMVRLEKIPLEERKETAVIEQEQKQEQEQDREPPTTPQASHHRLAVIPDVADSSVSVSCDNGQKYFGIASPDNPLRVETAASSCKVVGEKQGYQPVSEEIALSGDMKLPVALKQLFLVTVSANLGRSTVLLDGREAGTAGTETPALLSVPAGRHVITVSNPGTETPVQKEVEITKDQHLNIDLPVPRLPVTHPFSVRSNIDKTVVYVKCKDGKEYSGRASPEKFFQFEATVGSCTVSAGREGYETLIREVTIPSEQELSLYLSAAVPEVQEVQEVQEKTVQPRLKKQQVRGGTERTETEKEKVESHRIPEEQETILQSRAKRKPAEQVNVKTKRSEPEQKKKAPPPITPPTTSEKRDCQKEISIGMPELCDE